MASDNRVYGVVAVLIAVLIISSIAVVTGFASLTTGKRTVYYPTTGSQFEDVRSGGLCKETDFTKNPLVAGRAYLVGVPEASYADECVGTSAVREAYCTALGTLVSEVVSCPRGYSCVKGACAKK